MSKQYNKAEKRKRRVAAKAKTKAKIAPKAEATA
jgi:hypothetical protein